MKLASLAMLNETFSMIFNHCEVSLGAVLIYTVVVLDYADEQFCKA